MDFIGPFPRTTQGARYVVVTMDYASRYPEAIPLPSLNCGSVARSLMKFFAQVGLP